MTSERLGPSDRPDSSVDDGVLIDAARREMRAAGQAPADTSTQDSPTEFQAAVPPVRPDSFAGYDVLRELHRGGQGVVYQAIQKSTHRKVAIKVMREGPFASRAERARFDREIYILGQLNHPNIVAIHDSGEVAGCHYFVMDYVRGQPLDVWMAGAAHSIEETLALFAKICNAVNAAHLRGITHRDLKPGNIRIEENSEPHVLDFGLAKVALADDSAGGATAMTMTGQFVGSLPWASPEQAEGVPGKIDIRTDVYSLGVILYQMLTGRFPYEVIGAMHDVLDRILHAEPNRPSAIRPQINDEVETIVLKCLAKERERRYQSAGELARDIGHYLADEPIEAKRDSVAYVLGKYLQKYRVRAAVAGAFLLVIVVGLVGSLTFWRDAVVERGRAEQARQVADERRAAAEASEVKAVAEAERADRAAAAARKQAAIAESVNKLISDMLARANPGAERGNPNVTVREVMDVAARELETGTTRYEPEVEAAIRTSLGRTYRALGLYDEAERHLRAALAKWEELTGRESLGVADVLEGLSVLLMDEGLTHADEARPLAEEAVAIRRRLLGDQHPAVAEALHTFGTIAFGDVERSEAALSEALALRRKLFGDEDLSVAETLSSLATVAMVKGEWAAAEGYARQALAVRRKLVGDEHPDVAASLNQIGDILSYVGDSAGAEPLFRQALAIYRQLLGDEHPLVAMAAGNLGRTLHKLGDLAGAEPLLREGLEIRRRFDPADPQLAYNARNLGLLLCDRGDYAGGEPALSEAVTAFDRCRYYSGDDCIARIGLGDALAHLDRFAEAEAVLIDADARLATIPRDRNAVVRASSSIPLLRWRAMSLLADLYDRWHTAEPDQGHDQQAAEWRAKLAEWQASTQPAPRRQ